MVGKQASRFLVIAMLSTGCATTQAGAAVEMTAAGLVGMGAGVGTIVTADEAMQHNGSIAPPIVLGLLTVGCAALFLHGMYVSLQPKATPTQGTKQ